jgi:hypothetical protein
MGVILTSLLPALFPALADGVRGVFGMLTGGKGAAPQNVAEVIQLMQADTARLQVLQALDAPGGNVSPWVANVRAMQRPAAVALVLGAYFAAVTYSAQGHALPAGLMDGLANYAEMVTFYLFGDRSYAYMKAGKAGK